MSKDVLLYGPKAKVTQTTHSVPLVRTTNKQTNKQLTKASEKLSAFSKSDKGGSDQDRNQDFMNAENEKKLKMSTKDDEKPFSGGDEDLSPEAMDDSRKAEKMLLQRQMRKKIKGLGYFLQSCFHEKSSKLLTENLKR